MRHLCLIQKRLEQVLHPTLINVTILFHRIYILRLPKNQDPLNYVVSEGQTMVRKHASLVIYLKMAAILDLDHF